MTGKPDHSFQSLILTLQQYWARQGCVNGHYYADGNG